MNKFGKITLTEKQEKWLVAHFKHTKNDEIMLKLGLSHSTLHRIARELGLKKTPQFMRKCQEATTQAAWRVNRANHWPPKGYQIPNSGKNGFKKGVTPLMMLGEKREAERVRKAAESRRKTVASEKRRILFGLPQKTKLKIGYSKKKVSYRYALRRRGYEIEYGGSEAYVTDNTERNLVIEQRAAAHGIRVCV